MPMPPWVSANLRNWPACVAECIMDRRLAFLRSNKSFNVLWMSWNVTWSLHGQKSVACSHQSANRGRSSTSQCQASVCLCLGMVGIHIPQKQATWAANSDKNILSVWRLRKLVRIFRTGNVAVFHNHHTIICKIAFIVSEPPDLEQNIIFLYCRARYLRKKRGSIILYFQNKN